MPVTLWIAVSALAWLKRLGGLGLFALGIADASVVPLPGSIDALTIVLAASNRAWWPYYAAMSTAGSVFGGYLTYRLGQKGGREALERRLSKPRLEKIYRRFAREGFGAIFFPAILPPPFPLVPFVLAAGALEYPPKNFLGALSLGRALRFTVFALLASIYGKSILGFLRRESQPILWTLLALAGGLAALWFYHRHKSQARLARAERPQRAA